MPGFWETLRVFLKPIGSRKIPQRRSHKKTSEKDPGAGVPGQIPGLFPIIAFGTFGQCVA